MGSYRNKAGVEGCTNEGGALSVVLNWYACTSEGNSRLRSMLSDSDPVACTTDLGLPLVGKGSVET